MLRSAQSLLAAACVFGALAVAGPALAAGSSSGSSSSSSSSSYGSSSTATANTDDAAALLAEAIEFNERGWYRRAVGNLRQVTRLEPQNADAWNELGFAYRNVDNYNQSARAYDRALELDPEHLGALNYQGFMYLETNQLENARANLSQLNALCGTCSAYETLKEALDAL